MSYLPFNTTGYGGIAKSSDFVGIYNSGNGVTAISGQNFVYKVNNVTDLTYLPVSNVANNTLVYVEGYYATSDGGGGLFGYNPISTATVDSGMVFQPNVGSGRWLRQNNGNNVWGEWFGAKGDGITDDLVSLRAALNYVNTVSRGTVYLAGKTYSISDCLFLNGNYVGLIGQGQNYTRIYSTSATKDIIRVGSISGASIAVPTISNFAISRATTGGVLINGAGGTGISCIKTSLAKISDIQNDSSQTSFYFYSATNTNVARCVGSSGPMGIDYNGFYWDGGQTGSLLAPIASSSMTDCIVDATNCSGTAYGVRLDGNSIADLYLLRVGTLRCSIGRIINGIKASAFTTPYNWDILMQDCTDDEFKINGLYITSNTKIGAVANRGGWILPSSTAGSNPSVLVQDSRGVVIDGLQIVNLGQYAGARGLQIQNSQNVQIANCQVLDQAFGIYLLNSSFCGVEGNTVYNQSSFTGSTAFLLSSASGIRVIGNTADGWNSAGFADDSSSYKNTFALNIVNSAHIPASAYSILGSGDINQNNVSV